MQAIFEAIKLCALQIDNAIKYEDTGYTNQKNSTNDTQLKLDVLSDKIIENTLKDINCIKSIISEEQEKEKLLNSDGKYIIAYDPLDGSSLVDVNLSVGSIFGIYENNLDGSSLVASIYIVYGPRVELVIAHEDVKLYRLNKNSKFEFMKKIYLNEYGKINATGGTQSGWSKSHKTFIDNLFSQGYRLRYSGGMVPDLHQILLKGGGLFSYPSTLDAQKGKLRMLFEVFPFALVFELAGGEASNGFKRLLELSPTHIHDTTPCFFGSKKEIKALELVYKSELK